MASDAYEHLARVLPDYDLGRELGRGQLGVVVAARHRQLGRDVAVKQLMGGAADEENAARFRREARIMAQLDHPHVVTVYDYREDGSTRLLVMELLTGGSFADTCRKGVGVETAVAGTMAAASGLHDVHRRGVLHRDVKPENMMLTGNGVLKVTDFGLARGEATDQTAVELTQAGSFLGTPAYAAPEQVAEAFADDWPAVGPAADQWALASVLYFALAGTWTHDASGGLIALCYRRMSDEPTPLLDAAPTVPPAIAATIMRALERDPGARYESVEAFGVALGEAANADLGTGWSDRSDFEIRAAGPIRAAAEAGTGHPAPLAAAGARPTGPGGTVVGPAPIEPAPTGRRWARVLVPIVVVAALVAGLAVFARARSNGSAAAGAASSGPAGPTALPVDLEPAWQFTTGGDVFASPLVTPDEVVIGSADQKLYGLDPSTGTQRWAFQTQGAVRSSATPSADGTTAYVGSGDGELYAVGLSDGSRRWKADIGYEVVSSPAVGGDQVVVGADALYAFAAADGSRRWRFETGDVLVSSPAVADGVVYVGSNNGKVFAVDASNGTQRWTYDSGGPVQSSPVVRDGFVYVGTSANAVVALDAASGAVRWRSDVGGAVRSTPAVSATSVYVGTSPGKLLALDRGTGTTTWSFVAQGNVDSSPLVAGSHVVVGSTDGNLYVVSAATGNLEGRFAVGAPVLSSPRLAGTRVVVGGYDDKVHALTGLA